MGRVEGPAGERRLVSAAVLLSYGEFLSAAQIGLFRNAEAILMQRQMRFKESKTGELWGAHIQSAIAELAVAKYLGRHWGMGVNDFHQPDIAGLPVEVRWSDRTDCKVRPDDRAYVVSVGPCDQGQKPRDLTSATYRVAIQGWIAAHDAMRPEWQSTTPPVCYFVPVRCLNPPDSLKAELREWAALQREESRWQAMTAS